METNLLGDTLVMGSTRHLCLPRRFIRSLLLRGYWGLFMLTVSWQFTQQFHHLIFCELYPYAFQVIVQLNKVNLLTFKKIKSTNS